MSYEDYARGLELLGDVPHLHPRPLPVDRTDYNRAFRALDSLRSSMVGAGRNTYDRARERYKAARRVYLTLPRPCKVVLRNVAEPCQNVGPQGVCPTCRADVIATMRQTCISYGIPLDTLVPVCHNDNERS